nr:reverse transcriptase domain-containing protein [Tanacetum cinerariifolium]
NSDLTWWNSHKRTISVDAVYALKWTELIKLMTEVYCSRNEVQKMEIELWNLTMKGNDLTAYIQRTIPPEMSRSFTLITNNALWISNCGSLSVWVNSNPIIPSLVSNLLTVSTPYGTQPFMVQLALVAVGEKPNILLSFIVPSRHFL